MPNRIIKESTFSSEKIAQLSDFEFRLWVGLITQADDAGRGDARPAIIKGRVFPLRDRITVKDIDAALHGLAAKGCVSLYTVGGKPYFWFPTWAAHQRVRECKPKYPGPDEADNPPQAAASCGELRQGAALIQSNPNTNPNTNPSSARGAQDPAEMVKACFFAPDLESAVNDWLKYKAERRESYKPTGLKSLLTQIQNNAADYGDSAVAEVIRQSMGSNYRGIVYDRLKRSAPKAAPQTSNIFAQMLSEGEFTDE